MNHWPFILGAYGIGLAAVLILVWTSYAAMRRCEAEADSLKGDR